MKKLLVKYICGTGLAFGLGGPFAGGVAFGQSSPGLTTVYVCHIPEGNPAGAVNVSVDIQTHLAHGDTLGVCSFNLVGDGPGGAGGGPGPDPMEPPVSPPPSGKVPGVGPKPPVAPVTVSQASNPGSPKVVDLMVEPMAPFVLRDQDPFLDFASMFEVISQSDSENSEIEF